jgi:hypothetical protein
VRDGEAPSVDRARSFIIVAHDRPELYEYLRRGLAGVENVEVIIDRRISGHWIDGTDPPLAGVGRGQPDIYDELILRGFVIKRLEALDQVGLGLAQA